ncbi:hypothetical protein TSAR_016365 [Trichomalopsis sarcophagae]|uniref:Uncharacterized protein n=1 Tax=Trichomalopsis sarcophagae TaxID=543379 RepID=A0A232EL90_9HYME|nr:hypothetical protein TSAR_016365 [Trichomalopsis sarcophagae]
MVSKDSLKHNHFDNSFCSSTSIFSLLTTPSNTNTSVESQDYEADGSDVSIQVGRGQRKIKNLSSNNDDLSDYEQEDNQPSEKDEKEEEEEISEEDEERSENRQQHRPNRR